MAVLLTGGTGKTSVHLARQLQDAGKPFVLASRRAESAAPAGMAATKFDWLDPATFSNPFQHRFPGGEAISAVYLVAPEIDDPSEPMNAFVNFAVKEHSVMRFVLLGDATDEPGGPHVGKVWQHLLDLGVEYCVLLPTWFMENFTDEQGHAATIKHQSKIYTASGDGRIPFISASDIAAIALRALTDEKPHNTSYSILGPELLTYDEIAAKLSSRLGRKIEHVKLTEEQRIEFLKGYGTSESFAKMLTSLEVVTRNGSEDHLNDTVERILGRPPQNFDAFAEEHMAA